MMNLLVSGILALSLTAQAGDACKGFKVETDAFTSSTNVNAVVQNLHMLTAVGIALQLQSGEVELQVTVKEAGQVDGIVAAGQEVPFLFGEGQVVNLVTNRDNQKRSYVADTQVMTNVPFTFGIDSEQLAMLITDPLSTIRLPLSSGPYDWKAKGKIQKKLAAAAACVQEHVPAAE